MTNNPFITPTAKSDDRVATVKSRGGRKPDPKLIERNQIIADARRNGEATLEELAQRYGLSRERIRQIAEKAGVDHNQANDQYQKRKNERAFDEAQEHAGVILMRYIGGSSPSEIGHDMNLQVKAVQEVLDEQLTDEIIAARTKNQTQQRFPDASDGPKLVTEPRNDRYWTSEKVMEALVKFARENGGRLPSSTQYQKISPTREDLPSFPTVRNRVGRWSAVRVEVNRLAR